MNIIFVSSEVSPFAKTGGLGDVSEALPLALNKLKAHSSVIMPLYKLVRQNGFAPNLIKSGIPVKIGLRDLSFDLSSLSYKNINFYFIGNDALYDRDGLYGTPKGDHGDNAMRFAFFSKAVLESIPYIGKPDILHCNDWQTGLIPLYLRYIYKERKDFKKIKVLFAVHNMAYQGLFGKEAVEELKLPEGTFTQDGIEFYGKASFIKSGIVYSEAVSTVSEGYAREVLTAEFGCGLDGILRTRKESLYGILNGADYSTWNPETDKFIAGNFTKDDLRPKLECKKDLCGEFGLEFDEDRPIIGMITRLAEQKGVDLVVEGMDGLLDLGASFVILGTGDEKYNSLFKDFDRRYKGRAGAKVAFDNPLAHKIEAGCDMFLMPSRYEPCGLNQMYSLRYATIPIVRATGGLKDTIEDFDPHTKKGNGFKFKEASCDAMLKAIGRAVGVFRDKKTWRALQKNGLRCDFSWDASAKRYLELYKKIKSG
ncbi:MAG: glycogen synthase GlgA [Candidatus Omnitrophica bacterium]|nr:glycogen synthase GlgA [Candidatus Omnitrophota bacterium]